MSNHDSFQRVTYKPALLAAQVSYEVTETALLKFDKSGGLLWRIPFAGINGLAFVELIVRGMRMRRLDVQTAEGTQHIALNISSGVGPDDPDRVALTRIHSDLAKALTDARPDLMVKIGEYGRGKLWFFGTGVFFLLGAVGFLIAAIATGLSGEKLIGALAFAGFLTVFGGTIVARYNPWRKTPSIPISTLAMVFDHIDNPAEN